MVTRLGGDRSPAARTWMWTLAGLSALVAVAVADLATSERTVLTAVLIAAPLISSMGATPRQTAIVAALAAALSVPLAIHNGIWGTSRHFVTITIVLVGATIAMIGAAVRERRERELAVARPQALDAQRLRLALDAAEMGTWRWDLRTGRVEWDARLERLAGLAPGTFPGTFDEYRRLIHPDDRERVLAAVDDGMRRGTGWRFDHRVVWPDGTIHWIEGRGEPVHDEHGSVTGASGVAMNVDARHALLDAERRAREAAEEAAVTVQRLADATTALAGATTLDDVGRVIVEQVVATLGARSGYFATVDGDTEELVMRAQSGYPDWVVRDYARVPLDAVVPGTEAVRTGTPVFIESPEDRRSRFPQYTDDPTHGAFVVVPLTSTDGPQAVLAFGYAEPHRFSPADRAYVGAVVDACAQALRRAHAFEAEQQARRRLRTLLESSEALGALDDPDRVVATIAQLAATRIGTWATVVRIRPDGHLERAQVAHRDPALVPIVRECTERLAEAGALRHVIDTGEPRLLHGLQEHGAQLLLDDDHREKLARIGGTSCVMVPITIAGRRLAVLSIGDERPELLRPAEVELAVDLGRRGASALERAELWQASRRRLEAEHRIVEQLQRTIIPERLPALPGVQLAAAYRPAEIEVDVGGDWYDAFVAPDGSVIVVVGDVAGHGIEAASLTGQVRNALRAYANEDCEPATILGRLHNLLHAQERMHMVTAFVARHDVRSSTLTWARAGHPPPLLLHPDGTTRWLDDVNGAPLGLALAAFGSATTELPAGSLLVCYTDGLIERRDRVLDDGLAWLRDRVREYAENDLETICDKLVGDPFVSHPAPDDMCVLVLRTGAAAE
jgi:serine phosphatase RsbU (regulator of sigma subunit)/PAS domain-containing protein